MSQVKITIHHLPRLRIPHVNQTLPCHNKSWPFLSLSCSTLSRELCTSQLQPRPPPRDRAGKMCRIFTFASSPQCRGFVFRQKYRGLQPRTVKHNRPRGANSRGFTYWALKIFWIDVYRPTHHLTSDQIYIYFFYVVLEERNFFCFYL